MSKGIIDRFFISKKNAGRDSKYVSYSGTLIKEIEDKVKGEPRTFQIEYTLKGMYYPAVYFPVENSHPEELPEDLEIGDVVEELSEGTMEYVDIEELPKDIQKEIYDYAWEHALDNRHSWES